MKDALGGVIYVGKARDLKKRLGSYFMPSRSKKADPKTRALIQAIADVEYHIVRTEQEALLLEQKLIKDWRPRYNIQFRDDKRFLMVRVRPNLALPYFEIARQRKQDGSRYWGPFAHSTALKETLDWLSREFGLRTCLAKNPDKSTYKHCHADIIRDCSAPCIGRISHEEYQERFEEAVNVFEGKGRRTLLKKIEEEMLAAAETLDFERAASLRDIYQNLNKTLEPARRFRTGKGIPTTVLPQEDLHSLGEYLGLPAPPTLMECFDISNISDTHVVASMVRFRDGSSDNSAYRRYRIKGVEGQNDFASMAEVIRRRYGRILRENATFPDLIVVDGGKGQLSVAVHELKLLNLDIPIVGLAKKREEIFFPDRSDPLIIPHDTGALRLMQRIRDEAHRFANKYNELLMKKRMDESLLDDCPGMTRPRKELLWKRFKSKESLKKATLDELKAIPGLSSRTATSIRTWLDGLN